MRRLEAMAMTCRTGVFAAPTEKGCCSIPPMLQGVIGPGIVALAPHAQAHGTKSRPLAIVAVKAEDGQERDERSGRSRRGILLASAAAVLVASSGVEDEAAAFSLGISGPKEWLREQKKKTSQFLLAPILSSKDQLQRAVSLFKGDSVTTDAYQEGGELVKRASRDCMPPAAGSVLDFQSRSGIQVCTFRLILKNAASLMDKEDPVRVRADASLDELIRSLTTLDGVLEDGAAGAALDRNTVVKALREAQGALDDFEAGVRDCLGIGAA